MNETYLIDTEESAEDFRTLLSNGIEVNDNVVTMLSGEYEGDNFEISRKFGDLIEECQQIDLDDFIFGKDKTQEIVGLEVVDGEDIIFFRDGRIEKRPHVYWVLLDFKFDASCKKLKGNQNYQYIKICENEEEYKRFCSVARRFDIFNIWDDRESAMVYHGLTFFKGLKLEDIAVLSFDIESDGLVKHKKSRVYMISNTFQKDGKRIKKLFVTEDYKNDGEMISAWCDWVREINPSVIVGHNIFGYDFGYLHHVAKKHKFKLILGVDNSEIKFSTKSSNYRVDGTQTWSYKKISIFGRQIFDTMFLSVKYDIGRNYPSWGLKPIVEYEGLVKEDRQFYDASKIKDNWRIPEERAKIIEYGKDDADDALNLFYLQVPSYFYMTQSIPKPFQTIGLSASGAWLNSIMVRGYLQKGYSIPKKSDSKRVAGGMSYGIPGIYSNVSKWDAASFYPSTIMSFKLYDKKKDPKAYYYKMVTHFTNERFKNKRLFNESGDSYFNDLQASQKVFINSAYGLMGTNGLNFNNFDIASEITRCCRKGLQKCILWATGKETNYWWSEYEEEQDYEDYSHIDSKAVWSASEMPKHDWKLVNIDTDSLSFAKQDESPWTEEEYEMMNDEINKIMYSAWEDDGLFDRFVVVKAKNYAMRELGKDKIKIKGSSFTDSKKEPALKELLKKVLTNFIEGDTDYLKVYEQYVDEIKNIQNITRWATKKSITETLLEGNDTAKRKVLDAIGDRKVSVGDKVFLYNVIDGEVQKVAKGEPVFLKNGEPKMVENKILRLAEDFDGDYDVFHYAERVYKTMKIFEPIIDMDKIVNYNLKRNRGRLK